jgi:hypothetical protein
MGSFPNPITASREIHTYAQLPRDVTSQPPRRSPLTHLKKLAAVIVLLGFGFWLGFGASTYHTTQASYPYYDTQKPVPPWSEPMALEGNFARGEEHK